MQRDTKEVLAELVGKLREKLDPKAVVARTGEKPHGRGLRPNLDRLTVGVDLGDPWSHYRILGLEGETLAEGQLRTTRRTLPNSLRHGMERVWLWKWGHTRLGCRK